MGKALVIENVNFSENKVSTVILIDPIPCTGISLNESTKSMTSLGSSFTLVPTLTPVNTSDTVTWRSSNESVATVNDGVVTQTGVGSAVITAMCGNQTATCSVVATNTLTYTSQLGEIARNSVNSGHDYGQVGPSGAGVDYACMVNTATPTTYKIRKGENCAISGDVYPILLGANGTNIVADVPDTLKFTAYFFNSETSCTYSVDHSSYAQYAKFISGDRSPYFSSVVNGDRTIPIPEGANSAVFNLYKSGGEVSAEDVASVAISVT